MGAGRTGLLSRLSSMPPFVSMTHGSGARAGARILSEVGAALRRARKEKGNSLDRQAYVENIIDHFQHPRNTGRLEDADVQLGGGNPGCGDLITVYVKVGDDRVEDVSFEGAGCTISQAGGSIVT